MDFSNWTTYLIEHALDILVAVLIAGIGVILANLLRRRLLITFSKHTTNQLFKQFIVNTIYSLALVILTIIVLSKLGIPTGSLLAVLGASSLAIALAMRDSLSNVAAGVILVFLQPFKVGDFVEVNKITGTIQQISLFNTRLIMPNNEVVFLPNSKILSENIINKTHQEMRRVELIVGIAYESNIKQAKQIISDLIDNNEKVLPQPEKFIGVDALADSSVNLVVRCWVQKENFAAVRYQLLEDIKLTLDEHDIGIPFPQMDIHVIRNS